MTGVASSGIGAGARDGFGIISVEVLFWIVFLVIHIKGALIIHKES